MQMRISDELNTIVGYSREEAMRTGSFSIGIDHLYLGIVRHGDNGACRTLRALCIDLDEFKGYIDFHIFKSESISYSELEHIVFSRLSQNVLNIAILEATRLQSEECTSAHLLLALIRSNGSSAQTYLTENGITYESVLTFMQEENILPPQVHREEMPDEPEAAQTAEPEAESDGKLTIEEFGFDLTLAAQEGRLDPVVGRDTEIERVVEILGRRKKNNPMLIGEPGVGKSAIVEGIAIRIATGKAPAAIASKRLFSLDIGSVVAGTRYRGDFEKRIKNIIAELKSHPEIILFIDEFHTIVGAGGAQGSLDAANMLKPALARGEIQCIGATTMDEFAKIIEKDGALDRRFQKVTVDPADIKQTIDILRQLRPRYEEFHKVTYTDDALEACVRQTDRYIPSGQLPDKAIDAMDEAGSMVRLKTGTRTSKDSVVGVDDVAEVVSKMSGIPAGKVAQSEGSRLLKMKKHLSGTVIGQEDAIDKVTRAICRNRAGLKDPSRPIGTFLFFGPTGVGKTKLAKSIAEYLFDDEDSIVRIDMSEYQEKIATSRLIGAPPGYVGYDEGGQLSEAVRRKPYCVVLLDEIEKAHPDIFNMLLQVLDEGRLTDSNNRQVSFRNTILIMTSNVGTRELEDYGKGVGFNHPGKNVSHDRRTVLDKAIRKTFPPEFINRIDEQIFFNSLSKEDIGKIIDIEISDLKARAAEAGYILSITAGAKQFVAEAGYDPSYGARPLRRAVTRYIEDPVSEFILSDRMLGRRKAGISTKIKVALSKDKESTTVVSQK